MNRARRVPIGRPIDVLRSFGVSVVLLGLTGVAAADDSVPGGWDASIGFQSFGASPTFSAVSQSYAAFERSTAESLARFGSASQGVTPGFVSTWSGSATNTASVLGPLASTVRRTVRKRTAR